MTAPARFFNVGGVRQRLIPPSSALYFADPTSFFYQALPDDAPIHADSTSNAFKISNQARYTAANYSAPAPSVPVANYSPPFQQIFQHGAPSLPMWVVDSLLVPSYTITLIGTTSQLPLAAGADTNLQGALNAVPMPPDPGLTLMATGTDAGAAFYDKRTDTLWEIWRLKKNNALANGITYPWTCEFGGVYTNVSKGTGIFPNGWGQSACGRVQSATLIKMHEIANLHIPHALACGLPSVGPSVYAPFTRADHGCNLPGGGAKIGQNQGTNNIQPTLTTIASAVNAGDSTIAFAAVPAGFSPANPPRTWDLNVLAPSSTPNANFESVMIDSFSGTTAHLLAPAQFAHSVGEPLSINPRTDGVSEGAFFRFPHNVVIPSGLTPLAQAVMIAIRDYGLLVGDGSGVFGLPTASSAPIGTQYSASPTLSYDPFGSSAEQKGKGSLWAIPWEQLVQVDLPALITLRATP